MGVQVPGKKKAEVDKLDDCEYRENQIRALN